MQAVAKIENAAPNNLSITQNIGCLAAHDNKRESELARANDFYAAVLAMVTHDLRQPLQVIVGSHELLAQKLIAGPERRHLHHAQQASRELAARLDQLTDVFRIQQRSGHVPEESVPLQPLFQRLAQELAELARAKSIELRFVRTDATIVSSATILEGMVRNQRVMRSSTPHSAVMSWSGAADAEGKFTSRSATMAPVSRKTGW